MFLLNMTNEKSHLFIIKVLSRRDHKVNTDIVTQTDGQLVSITYS